MGCLSGDALVEDDRIARIAIHLQTGLVTICKDIAAERMFLLWVGSMGRQHLEYPPCPFTVLDIAL